MGNAECFMQFPKDWVVASIAIEHGKVLSEEPGVIHFSKKAKGIKIVATLTLPTREAVTIDCGVPLKGKCKLLFLQICIRLLKKHTAPTISHSPQLGDPFCNARFGDDLLEIKQLFNFEKRVFTIKLSAKCQDDNAKYDDEFSL